MLSKEQKIEKLKKIAQMADKINSVGNVFIAKKFDDIEENISSLDNTLADYIESVPVPKEGEKGEKGDKGLTSGRVPFATTNGRLIDDADMTFATDTLTVTKLVGATSVKVGTAAGYISSDGSTGATGTFTTADLKTVTVKDGIITSIV